MAEMEGLSVADQPQAAVPDEGPLVVVTFQKNPHQIRKYLEAEPKALGITEILFSMFQISLCIVTLNVDFEHHSTDYALIIGSIFIMVAGGVAIAAKNLHLPTLKACLALQVLACLASVSNLIVSAIKMSMSISSPLCWVYHDKNHTAEMEACKMLLSTYEQYSTNSFLLSTALIAISATLAAYCCKVVDCCCPKSKMPVITINAPQAPQ